MNYRSSLFFTFMFVFNIFSICDKGDSFITTNFKFVKKQYGDWITVHYDTTKHPNFTNESGEWVTSDRRTWTSGFFAGCLWKVYEYSGETKWREFAEAWTTDLDSEKYNSANYDLGFRLFCSYGNGYRLTQNDEYKKVILSAADSLAKRFNSEIGMLKSWDEPRWEYPVVIDNMMNLELLFWASKNGGLKQLYDIAVKHANNVIKHHIRDDGSTYQVVDFNQDGSLKWRGTRQGYSDESTWARGQASAIYGFIVTYRETRNEIYLKTARKLADYFIDNLPDDYIPYSDFDSPKIPDCEKDVSAAAIASCALQELDKYVPEQRYKKCALKILKSLSSSSYLAEGTNYESILRRASRFHNDSEKGLIYADYYFLDSLLRLAKIER